MKLLRKLFGLTPKTAPQPAPIPVAEPKPAKPVITLDIVENTSDQQALATLAAEGATSQLRQAAAQKITDRTLLDSVAKTVKTKDKNVFKIVKAKLDEFKAEDQARAEQEAHAVRLCERLEKHVHNEADALFKATLGVLTNEFNALNTTNDALSARFAAAVQACNAKLDARAQQIAEEEEQQRLQQQAKQLAEEAVNGIDGLAKDMIAVTATAPFDKATFEVRLQELASAFKLALNRDSSLTALQKRFELRKQQLLSLMDQISLSGTPAELHAQVADASEETLKRIRQQSKQLAKYTSAFFDELPSHLTSLQNAVNERLSHFDAAEAATKNALREFGELLRKGQWAAEQGFVRKARAIQKDLTAKRESLSRYVAELPKTFQTRIDDFEAQLAKLGDWHEFAVTPKKEALIEQMRALATSDLAPDARAARIHDLQDSWKEVSKGAQQADDSLWQSFQEASVVAYAPCKEFFEAQAAVRNTNLAKREELVSTLRSYLTQYNFEQANWKDVEQTLKTARAEWQGYWPVPRKAGNDIQKEFESLMEQLFAKISHHYDANKQAKTALVEQAALLIEQDDVRSAADRVKQLQAEWKAVGKSWARDDHQLWQQFRTHCDAIFAKRNHAFESAKALRDEMTTKASALLDQIATYTQHSAEALGAVRAEIDELVAEFRSLSLPKDAHKTLSQRLTQLMSDIDSKRVSAKQAARIEKDNAIFALAARIRSVEIATLEQQAGVNEQRDALVSEISEMDGLSSSLVQLFKTRTLNSASIDADKAAADNECLRLLTIRAEIIAQIDSPSHDKERRLNYQVQQLQQGIGQRETDIEPLYLEWLSTSATLSDYDDLLQRFRTARAK